MLPPCQLCAELLQTPLCHVLRLRSTAGHDADTLRSIRIKTSQGTPNQVGLKVGNKARAGREGWKEEEEGEKTRNITSDFEGIQPAALGLTASSTTRNQCHQKIGSVTSIARNHYI